MLWFSIVVAVLALLCGVLALDEASATTYLHFANATQMVLGLSLLGITIGFRGALGRALAMGEGSNPS